MAEEPFIDWDKYFADQKAKDERIKELEAEKKKIENLAKIRFAMIETLKEYLGKIMGIIEEMEQALKG